MLSESSYLEAETMYIWLCIYQIANTKLIKLFQISKTISFEFFSHCSHQIKKEQFS